jgi:hypothetical protein
VFCEAACRRAWHSWRESRSARAIELKRRGERRPGSLAALTAFPDDLLRDYRECEARRIAMRLRTLRGSP